MQLDPLGRRFADRELERVRLCADDAEANDRLAAQRQLLVVRLLRQPRIDALDLADQTIGIKVPMRLFRTDLDEVARRQLANRFR